MSSTRFETIIYEKSGPVARLTMNRPDRLNGMTNRMLIETRKALEAAAEDRELRVLVLTGAGRGFCPGADIGRVASAPRTILSPSTIFACRSCSTTCLQ